MKKPQLMCLLVPTFTLASQFASAFDDPANDFISTYAFDHNPDVDVLHANVDYDGTSLIFTSTMAGDIGQTAGALYVWGFNRGQGTARFSPAIPNTDNILFDSVVILRPDTTATVSRIVGGGSTNFGAGTVSINGASMAAVIPVAELPELGFTKDNYTWNLWPRVGTGNNNQISDFAPDNANVKVNVVPEPVSMLAFSAGLVALVRRKIARS